MRNPKGKWEMIGTRSENHREIVIYPLVNSLITLENYSIWNITILKGKTHEMFGVMAMFNPRWNISLQNRVISGGN